jgi:UDPglucose 6-dehydrogenase
MKITVVGVGYVGLVAAACFAEAGTTVFCVDKDGPKIRQLRRGKVPIYEPGLEDIIKRNITAKRLIFTASLKQAVEQSLIIFIAVGTPSVPDGSADISAVLEVSGQIAEYMPDYRIIATKSTVPVGTCRKVSELISSKTDKPFDYVSNPEFLKEGSAVEDFLKPERVIVGTTNPKVSEIMTQLYAPLMRQKPRMIFMDPVSAEMTKYAANVMLAARISFMNELSVLCEKLGADIELIRQGIGSDRRIGSAFLFPGIGFGGSCLPKDVRALIHTGKKNNCPAKIVEAIQQVNKDQQKRFAQKIINYFKNTPNTNLAVWGLAFKARTDDIRESPAIYCIEKFLAAGLGVTAYDPVAMANAKQYFSGKLKTAKDLYSVLNKADALVILTDWHQFRSPDFEIIKKRLKKTVIFDGRNLYDPDWLVKNGIEYHSIGRTVKKVLK